MKQIFVMAHGEARRRAVQAVMAAPPGHVVTVDEPKRSLDQNAALWPLLAAFSEQKCWVVNGQPCWLSPQEWKDVLTVGFDEEGIRVAPGIHGGMVFLGRRTSVMRKKRFSEFLDWINATAAEMGVRT